MSLYCHYITSLTDDKFCLSFKLSFLPLNYAECALKPAFHLRASCMEAQREKRVKLVLWRRETEISRMDMEKWLRKRVRFWPFAFVPPPCSSAQTRATPGRREGYVSASSARLALKLTVTLSYSRQTSVLRGPYARGQCLTLTWMSPLMVDISEECTSVWSLHAAGYSSKRDTVHTLSLLCHTVYLYRLLSTITTRKS